MASYEDFAGIVEWALQSKGWSQNPEIKKLFESFLPLENQASRVDYAAFNAGIDALIEQTEAGTFNDLIARGDGMELHTLGRELSYIYDQSFHENPLYQNKTLGDFITRKSETFLEAVKMDDAQQSIKSALNAPSVDLSTIENPDVPLEPLVSTEPVIPEPLVVPEPLPEGTIPNIDTKALPEAPTKTPTINPADIATNSTDAAAITPEVFPPEPTPEPVAPPPPEAVIVNVKAEPVVDGFDYEQHIVDPSKEGVESAGQTVAAATDSASNTTQAAADTAEKVTKNISWKDRITGGVEIAAGVTGGLALNTLRTNINKELDAKQLGGQPINFGDRTKQVLATAGTFVVAPVVVADGLSRSITGEGIGKHVSDLMSKAANNPQTVPLP